MRDLARALAVNTKTAHRLIRALLDPRDSGFFDDLAEQIAPLPPDHAARPPAPSHGPRARKSGWLTVCALRALGYTPAEISDQLSVSERRVKAKLATFAGQLRPELRALLAIRRRDIDRLRPLIWRIGLQEHVRGTVAADSGGTSNAVAALTTPISEEANRLITGLAPPADTAPLDVVRRHSIDWSAAYGDVVFAYRSVGAAGRGQDTALRTRLAAVAATGAMNVGLWPDARRWSLVAAADARRLDRSATTAEERLLAAYASSGAERAHAILEWTRAKYGSAILLVEASLQRLERAVPTQSLALERRRAASFVTAIRAWMSPADKDVEKALSRMVAEAPDEGTVLSIRNNELEVRLRQGRYDRIEELLASLSNSQDWYDAAYHEALRALIDLHGHRYDSAEEHWLAAVEKTLRVGLLNALPSLLRIGELSSQTAAPTDLERSLPELRFLVAHPIAAVATG